MCNETRSAFPSADLEQQQRAICRALLLLLGSHRGGQVLPGPREVLSGEMLRLRKLGVSDDTLRQLVAQGYFLKHGGPMPPKDESQQRREPLSGALGARFILWPRELALAEQLAHGQGSNNADRHPTGPEKAAARIEEKPEWGPTLRELRYKGLVVKRFKRAAPNQECVLTTFQELEWAARIDDPLPRAAGACSQERLRETVKSLNRGREARALLFRVEADAQGIRWTPL